MTSEIASLVRGGTHQGRRKLMDYEDKIIIDKGFWLTGPMHCWRCSKVTSVTAMVVAQGLEAVGDEMVSIDEPMFVTSICDLPEPLVKQLETVNPNAIFPNEGPEEGSSSEIAAATAKPISASFGSPNQAALSNQMRLPPSRS